ncbi:immunity-related GTPase family M protein [Otolemur garnettii]|uniref:immunity-related GTPase family M protein n=1 Tax=Otolemur garnettii TaxID=30611 RepID=UPI0006447356|nr:immunity-related GTPase family M protein [Otolemur garnettii]XP_023372483.1 immunity-related GTPase family M protein [Otolemur garnettii]XP_023372490.1 immunity-related GTPase family M protein [Otolemur garnettii]XP_023372492.1 immunity-related GTPase family M protein [Otolemur garnettii]
MNIEKAIADGNLPEVVSAIRETVKIMSRTPVNIAVTGDSGNGMSSFINALRNIGHEGEDSAPVGVVKTTHTCASYLSPHFPNVVLWDLPGTGCATDSLENYLMEMQFSRYDFFIIIASEQFSVSHVMLAKTIEDMRKKFYIVWTKLDMVLSTSALTEGQLRQSIIENILENLQKKQVCEPPIFLVSSLEPLLHDFPKLRDMLRTDLIKIRCHDLLQKLSHTCEMVINDKVTSLQKKITTQSFQDACGISDADDLAVCLNAYQSFFGVDDESLWQVAQRMGRIFTDYMNIMKPRDVQVLSKRDWKMTCMTCAVMKAFLSLLSYIPWLGDYIICYFRGMKHRLLLAIVAEDTKTILRKVLEDSIIPQ